MRWVHSCMDLGTLAFAWVLPLSSQGRVWVVEDTPGPGFDCGTIQEVVDAAADGDALLDPPGSCLPFLIDAKSLDVTADGANPIALVPNDSVGIRVEDLAAHQTVFSSGFWNDASFAKTPPALTLEQGHVRAENCSRKTRYEGAAAIATHRALVTLLRRAVGADTLHAVLSSAMGKRGRKVDHANPQVFGRSFKSATVSEPEQGSEAARPDSSFLFASGSAFHGARRDPASFNSFTGLWLTFGDGGAGLQLVDTSAWNLVVLVPGGAPEREGQSVVLTCAGLPGEILFPLASGDQCPLCFQSWNGTALPSPGTLVVVFQGIRPPSGILHVSSPLQELGAGVQSIRQLYAQANFIPDDGSCHLSSNSALTALDAGVKSRCLTAERASRSRALTTSLPC